MPNLYTKYRPTNFDEIVGQDSVIKSISTAILQDKLPHAYLFQGPRGTGKTSTARILAKVINCREVAAGHGQTPCEVCTPCKYGSQDLVEIDAASNRGIEDVQRLQEQLWYKPRYSEKKVVIIDECHQLTTPAINALLKTVEEPPANVVFIFCTTNQVTAGATQQQAAMQVLISRLMVMNFKPISVEDIASRLTAHYTLETGTPPENKNIEDGIILLANRAKGSLRDAENLLEVFITTYINSDISDAALEWLFPPEEQTALRLVEFLAKANSLKALPIVNEIKRLGMSPSSVIQYTIELLSDVLDIQLGFKITRPQDVSARLSEVARVTPPLFTTHALRCLGPIKNSEEYTDLNIVIINITEPWYSDGSDAVNDPPSQAQKEWWIR